MIDINDIKTAYTHAGVFHLDDVMSSVFLRKLNKKIRIKRVVEVPKTAKFCFDIGLGKFDHHQKDREINNFGVPYSAFGLLWREFGEYYLKKAGFKYYKEAFNKFNKDIVSKIDFGDNFGYKEVKYFFERDIIRQFLPSWHEEEDSSIFNVQFKKAIKCAEGLFDNWIRNLFTTVEYKKEANRLWEKAKEENKNGILYLEKVLPWRSLQKENPIKGLKIIIEKNIRGGFSLVSIDNKIIKIQKNEYLQFVHPSNFMGITKNKEDAFKAAELILGA